MCRFCACNLAKEQLTKKCAYKKNNTEHDVPWFTDPDNVVDYYPSNCLQPKQNGMPVIIHGGHVQSPENQIFCPMYWTLIPSWHKGGVNEWNATTHNARIEGITSSNIYSTALKENKRCVVTIEGFYEYSKTDSKSEVYYLESLEKNQLLKAAGLFSSTKRDGKTLYTCTVITTEASSNARKVHHRLPLLLNNESDVEAWLDYKSISSTDAVDKIKTCPQPNLNYHKTDKVGSRDKMGKKPAASSNLMANWLKSGNSKGLKRKIDE